MAPKWKSSSLLTQAKIVSISCPHGFIHRDFFFPIWLLLLPLPGWFMIVNFTYKMKLSTQQWFCVHLGAYVVNEIKKQERKKMRAAHVEMRSIFRPWLPFAIINLVSDIYTCIFNNQANFRYIDLWTDLVRCLSPYTPSPLLVILPSNLMRTRLTSLFFRLDRMLPFQIVSKTISSTLVWRPLINLLTPVDASTNHHIQSNVTRKCGLSEIWVSF